MKTLWGGLGVLPRQFFGLNGVKSCNFKQNKHGNGTFMKARDSVYEGRRDNSFSLEVIRICQIFILCIILASGASQKKNYQNKIKITFGPPLIPIKYPQDPTSDKSQGGGGGSGPPVPPPSGSAHGILFRILATNDHCNGNKKQLYVYFKIQCI